ncbi:MAG: 30S ribosomal protein S9 [Planctomycetota bacterium]
MSTLDVPPPAETLDPTTPAEPVSPVISPVLETESEAPATETRPLAEAAKPDKGGFVWGTGRRKAAVARVRVRPVPEGGAAELKISSTKATNRNVDEFFSEPQHQAAVLAPLKATNTLDSLQVYITVKGGGITGQAEAILLGVARALKGYDPTLEQTLRDENFLTRDPRKVERKKYGQRGARRRFQFSKR